MTNLSNPQRPRLAALVMAAGESRRFGHCKLLCRVEGVSLIAKALALAAVADERLVITGAYAEPIEKELESLDANDIVLRSFAGWRHGLGASLAFGVRCLPESCDAVLVLLADQALLQREDIEALVQAWRGAPERIVCAHYDGRRAVPAIFPRSYWPELLALRADEGARALLRGNRECTALPLARAAFDLDTQADWQTLLALTGTAKLSAQRPGPTTPGLTNGESSWSK